MSRRGKGNRTIWWLLLIPVVIVIIVASMVATQKKALAEFCGVASLPTTPTQSAPANADLLTAIKAVSGNDPRLAVSLLMGTYFESRRDPSARSSDGGFGAYQIQTPGARPGPNPGITVQQALDPAYSTNYMLKRYSKAVKAENPLMWKLDPMMAGHNVAYNAERPYDKYITVQGASVVRTAYSTSLVIMKSWGMDTTFGVASRATTPTPTPSGATSAPPAERDPLPDVCNPYQDVTFADDPAQQVIKAAQKYLGTPYVRGGGSRSGPTASNDGSSDPGVSGFDDTGLTLYAYYQAGVTLPRPIQNQYVAYPNGRRALGQEQPGDLVFFSEGDSKTPNHVGIVVDPSTRTMIHTPITGGVVMYDNYTQVRRLLGFIHALPDSTSLGKYVRDRIGPDGFTYGQCGQYVGYVIRKNIPNFPSRSIGYYGKDFANNLGTFGYKVNSIPAIHAVVSFPTSLGDDVAGHVAFVSGFNPDGSIEVEEFNWDTPNRYGTHIVPKSIVNKLTYAHIQVDLDKYL